MNIIPKGIRWRGQKTQLFCCPNCGVAFKSKNYQLREPRGAVGAWAATHMYGKNCPNCNWYVEIMDMQETEAGFVR